MTDKDRISNERLSRRAFLGGAVVGSSVLLGATLSSAPAMASGKLPQKAVQYQSVPKNGNRCSDCALWQLPASCKAVEGPISPAGWCSLYAPKNK